MSNKNVINYGDFMRGMTSAKFPYDKAKCEKCLGIGMVAVICCGGHECGCMGLPTDFEDCDECDNPKPTLERIMEWCRAAYPTQDQQNGAAKEIVPVHGNSWMDGNENDTGGQ